MTQHNNQHRIVVLGAGYTGLMCAIGTARRTLRHGGQVTLVNPSDRFTERRGGTCTGRWTGLASRCGPGSR